MPYAGSSTSKIGYATDGSPFAGAIQVGTQQFLGSGPLVSEDPQTSGGKLAYNLNLVDVPVALAVKSVIGDVLKQPYTIDPRVTGTVTLQTTQSVSANALVDILESALSVNNAVIIAKGGSYRIVPGSDAFSSTPRITSPANAPTGPGIKVQAIPLRYIGADEMKSILEPISRPGAILRADANRNLLVLAGTAIDLSAMRDSIATFDIDWMRGMSVALYPLKASQPVQVARELSNIFLAENGPGSKLVKFLPNERLNSVLVISSRRTYLAQAGAWIAKLDRVASTNEEQLFVYNIQNRPAKELAKVLQDVLSGKSASDSSSARAADPNLDKAVAETTTPPEETGPAVADTSSQSDAMAHTSVVADVENNALLISTTLREYERVQRILKQLDVAPTQVLIEAVIAEVTLTDQLKFGLRWFFENGRFGVGFSDLASGGAQRSFPGFGWSFSSTDVGVALNALSSITNVNIVSAPTLMALNNQKATLQVGDQVPIVTQQLSSGLTSNTAIVSSIELKDTGIILNVTPRINASGRVMLDIDQEVSNVVKTTTSGIDSPTIQQRKISTRVIVADDEAVALGGLIQQKSTVTKSQVPILGDIPLLGNAFRNKDDNRGKTELLIFIKPRIVRDVQQARDVTDEFRQQMSLGKPPAPRSSHITRDVNSFLN